MQRTFETVGPITARIRLPEGEINVETIDAPLTELMLEAGDEDELSRIMVELAGDTLTVEVPDHHGLFRRAPAVEVHLRCPRGSRLEVAAASAELHAHGVFGSVDARTASGEIVVGHVEGDARLSTASGDVSIDSCAGRLELGTASGDVSVRRAAGGLRAELVSGDLEVTRVDGDVDLSTVSGEVRLEDVGPGSLKGTSVSGDIVVAIRQDCDVWMDLHTLSGETVSALEPRDGPAGDRSRLVEVRVNTVSGCVRIERSAEAHSV